MPNAINLPEIAKSGPLAHGFFEDFDHIVSADRWTKILDTGATQLVIDGAGGILEILNDTTDEDGSAIETTAELFQVLEGKPLTMSCRLQITEGDVQEANVAVGFSTVVTVDTMQITDLGPIATYDGAMIYKTGGSVSSSANTQWSVAVSNATTTTQTLTDAPVVSGDWQSVRIDITPINATDFEVTYFIDVNGGTDWVQMRQDGVNPRSPAIKHTGLITSMDAMHVFAIVKNGNAAADKLELDWIQAWQKR